jgi:hypothetical protein
MDAFLHWLPAFAEVMDRRYYSPEWLAGEVWSGRARFWSTDRAAIVAEIKIYPTGAMDVHGLVAAGDLGEIENILIPSAEQWGRDMGCTGAVIDSRDGWIKVMKQHGYAPFQTAIRKEL